MKPFKVVCIEDFNGRKLVSRRKVYCALPVKGEIYTVIEQTCYAEPGYILSELDHNECWVARKFRPVSDCGPAICEWIEETHFKELEYQEAIK